MVDFRERLTEDARQIPGGDDYDHVGSLQAVQRSGRIQRFAAGDPRLGTRNGNKLGEIDSNGTKQTIRDKNGNKLGEYDSGDNVTRDKNGNKLGSGNTLTRLL